MRFDKHPAAYEQQDERLPDGTHECEIVKCKETTSKDGNPLLVVEFSAVDGGYKNVVAFFDPASDRGHKAAMQLADALGHPRDADFDASLVGRRVRLTTARGTKRTTGEPTVYANAYSQSATPAFEQHREDPPKPAARTPKQRAEKASSSVPQDDIPF